MAYPVAQSDPTAVFGRRVVATILDTILIAVPTIMAITSQLEYVKVPSGTGSNVCDAFLARNGGSCFNLNDTVYFNDSGASPLNFLGFGLALLIFVVLQGLTGWTPGKLVTGLRTVKADGSIVGIPKAFVRWILLIVDGQPCGLPLVGFITGLTTQGHRRVGDMAAKTFVVTRAALGSPIVVPGMTAPPPPGEAWGSPAPAANEWATPAPPAGGWSTLVPGAAPAEAVAPPPQWDEARGTHIQWDPSQNAWLQWDEPSKRWIVIAGQ